MVSALLIAIGLAGLVYGADLAVASGARLAVRMRVSTLAVGLTVTSIGTSVPEIATNLAVGVDAAAGAVDASGLAFGNILGSCLSQITLLLGVAALVAPLTVPREMLRRDGPAVVAAALLMWAACWDGTVSRLEGLGGAAIYLGYLGWIFASSPAGPEPDGGGTTARDGGRLLAGLVLVGVCAGLVVEHGVRLAEALNVSDTLIGIWVGVGTGFPELTVAVRAATRRDAGMSLGNLIGSNVTDPLLSFGLGAVVHPVHVPDGVGLDFAWLLACTAIALLLLREQRDLTRREGAVLITLFGLYLLARTTGG